MEDASGARPTLRVRDMSEHRIAGRALYWHRGEGGLLHALSVSLILDTPAGRAILVRGLTPAVSPRINERQDVI